MAEIQRLFQPDPAFDPETIEVLAAALDNAWETIEKSGSRFARPAYSRAMREVIAKRIIEMARSGIKDQRQLADDAVRFLEANYDAVHPARLLASYAGSNRGVGLVGAPSSVRTVRFGNFLDQTGFRK